jgi:transposase
MDARDSERLMITIDAQTHVYFARKALDMRKQIDGIALAVQEQLKLDPFSTQIFVFCNKQRNKLKLLYWHGNGFCLLYKRLEKGRFIWPTPDQTVMRCGLRELQWLLDGLCLKDLPERTLLPISAV